MLYVYIYILSYGVTLITLCYMYIYILTYGVTLITLCYMYIYILAYCVTLITLCYMYIYIFIILTHEHQQTRFFGSVFWKFYCFYLPRSDEHQSKGYDYIHLYARKYACIYLGCSHTDLL